MFFVITFYAALYAQSTFELNPFKTTAPQNKEHANFPGHYEIVATIDKTQINKGSSATVDVYITGYGIATQPKIFISCSSAEILNKVEVTHSLGLDGKLLIWGVATYEIDSLPRVMDLGGISFKSDDSTIFKGIFLDSNDSLRSTAILTEQYMKLPPNRITIYFNDNITPDNYKFNLNLTYFNGHEWSGSVASLDFRINSWWQKHEDWVVFVGALAALVGLLPGFQIARSLYIKLFRKKSIAPNPNSEEEAAAEPKTNLKEKSFNKRKGRHS